MFELVLVASGLLLCLFVLAFLAKYLENKKQVERRLESLRNELESMDSVAVSYEVELLKKRMAKYESELESCTLQYNDSKNTRRTRNNSIVA